MSQLLEKTYINLRDDLKAFIKKRVNNEELSEDILHDVFLKVHSNISKLKDSAKLNSWIYSITRNAIIDYYRSKKITIDLDEVDIADERKEKSIAKQLEPSIKAFIKSLPLIYREALILTDYRGLSQTRLAERLNISLSAAKSRVLRARKMIKEMFLECCHLEFDKFGSVTDYRSRSCNKCACE